MKIEDDNIIEITEELSSEYEVAKVLRQYPKDTVIIKNVKGFDLPVISGICNTREKIAKSIGIKYTFFAPLARSSYRAREVFE